MAHSWRIPSRSRLYVSVHIAPLTSRNRSSVSAIVQVGRICKQGVVGSSPIVSTPPDQGKHAGGDMYGAVSNPEWEHFGNMFKPDVTAFGGYRTNDAALIRHFGALALKSGPIPCRGTRGSRLRRAYRRSGNTEEDQSKYPPSRTSPVRKSNERLPGRLPVRFVSGAEW
jgi:hypothetical protein